MPQWSTISALVITVSATRADISWPLAHAVADHLAATELDLLAVDGEILLHLDPQVGVGEPHAVAGGRAEHLRVGLAGNFHLRAPITLPAKPNIFLSPDTATSSTVRACPGSKRTAVPAAMFSRKP